MEVICELVTGPVYLAGEEIVCRITFINQGNAPEVLAWASAQLNCFCTVSDSKVAILDKDVSRKSSTTNPPNSTSFQPCSGEAGLPVLSTTTKILFCDLSLAPGERRSAEYRETIPASASPTYRGTSVKYSYKVTVGTQGLGASSSLHRLPIRVLSTVGCSPSLGERLEEGLGPSNPFLETLQEVESPADVIMEAVQDVTSRRSASYFNIANTRGKVCRFCLFKKSYRLGEDIVGTFDFTGADLACVQYSVSLQLVESIESDYRVRIDQPDKVVTHSRHHEVCLGYSYSHMSLPVPLTLAPSFATPVCSVNYNLHFEFVTSADGLPAQGIPEEEGGSEWQGPAKLDIETMVWDLPVRIFPTYPNHAAQASQLSSKLCGSV